MGTIEVIIIGLRTVVSNTGQPTLYAVTRDGDLLLANAGQFADAGYHTEEWKYEGGHPLSWCLAEVDMGNRSIVKVLGIPPTHKTVKVIWVWHDVTRDGRERLMFVGADKSHYVNNGAHTGIFERAGYDVSKWGEEGFFDGSLNIICLAENSAIVAVIPYKIIRALYADDTGVLGYIDWGEGYEE